MQAAMLSQQLLERCSLVGGIRDAAGNLYGTTAGGGSFNCGGGCGTVFKLDTKGKETVLYRFNGAPDGQGPYAALIQDRAGNFYGTTSYGGNSLNCNAGCGTVFKLDTAGNETVLHSFTYIDGSSPTAGLIRDPTGNLYGTTEFGGNLACDGGCGTVFEVDSAGSATVLHSFTGTDGTYPHGGLVRDVAGNLYGTTEFGGSGDCGSGCGTVFKLDTTGAETVLYNFGANTADGVQPLASLVRDAAGDLYGTTEVGGAPGGGTVFKIRPTGAETLLHSFALGADGAYPMSGLVRVEGLQSWVCS